MNLLKFEPNNIENDAYFTSKHALFHIFYTVPFDFILELYSFILRVLLECLY
jgi:hypothetical protein